ncbi:MAG: hypothetical protein KIT17_16095 [Rubrivivax sp.]|nr:hypothetical protein [Rubrivivax sp.]
MASPSPPAPTAPPTLVFCHATGFPAGTYEVLFERWRHAGWRALAFGLLKASGLIRRGGPGRASARRREQWPTLDAAREHFAAKPAFARWDPRVFAHYVEHGFVRDEATGGVRLAFDRDTETRIYNTLPHHVPALLRRHPLHCPVGFVAGAQSAENRQLGLGFARRLSGARWRCIDGSHLFPMEKPEETAAAVLALLAGDGRTRA